MSTLDLSLLLNGVDRPVRGTANPQSPLRMVLVAGEALRLPLSSMTVGVLSGTAWVTQAGTDILLQAGARLDLSSAADSAVVSAVGTVPMLFEVH